LGGGKDNFEADRNSAEAILKVFPTARMAAQQNRRFLTRAVGFLAEAGVRQFLDVGTGIPTKPNTHEVAQEIDPRSRVVYVDNDPIVLAHARALLTSEPEGKTEFIDADMILLQNPTPPEGAWNQIAGMRAYAGTYPQLGQIDQPTLIIHGTTDRMVDPRNAELLARGIPSARLELLEGAGHSLAADQPERLTELIVGFLDAISADDHT
jgi:pimeloyl-ACP methyl ester carboxylesterase